MRKTPSSKSAPAVNQKKLWTSNNSFLPTTKKAGSLYALGKGENFMVAYSGYRTTAVIRKVIAFAAPHLAAIIALLLIHSASERRYEHHRPCGTGQGLPFAQPR
ncbi:MAG TPA: hypothetical protein VJB68_04475, partial [Methylophilaceae bacterium]|nr:hypothetical protein [Methylophilaceae bacterium]